MARVIATGTDLDALRARLRSGNLPEELLKPGPEVVLRAGDRRLTRKELRAEAEQVAGGLQQLGVKPGDRVAIYAASSLDWVIAYLGLQRAGAALVPMNPDYHSAEAEHILNDSDPTLVIADAPRAAIAHGLGRRVISVDELPRAIAPPMPDLTPESLAAIMYTSGTTGRPKGAIIDHGAVQCGYCIPGMILSAKAFLEERPGATEAEVREMLAGNLCRCTGYQKIADAVVAAGRAVAAGR